MVSSHIIQYYSAFQYYYAVFSKGNKLGISKYAGFQNRFW